MPEKLLVAMKKNVDFNLLVEAEKARYKSDFSSAHWFHQVISTYERGIENPLRRDAFEKVIRCAIRSGLLKAIELANTFPDMAGFPSYINLASEGWSDVQTWVNDNFEAHIRNRFGYMRDGD